MSALDKLRRLREWVDGHDLLLKSTLLEQIDRLLTDPETPERAPKSLGPVHEPVLFHLDDGKVARAVRVGPSMVNGASTLVVDLTSGDGPSVVGKPDWFDAGYVATFGGLVPECAEQGTEPGQWSYGVLAMEPESSFEQKMSREVSSWPEWKRKAAAAAFCSPDAGNDSLLAEPEPGAPSMWLVQLARDTDEACAWERAFDHLIVTMSRQGRLVGDEPERLGFLVRRGVQLMRLDHSEKNDAEADRSRDREPIPLPPAEDGQPQSEAQRGDRGVPCAGEEAARGLSGRARSVDRIDEAGGGSHVGEPVARVRLADGRVAPAPSEAEIEAYKPSRTPS